VRPPRSGRMPRTTRRTGLAACLLTVLYGCTRAPPPPSAVEQPLPALKPLLERNLKTLFEPSSNPRNIRMGSVRRFQTPSGLEYGTCVKASVTGLTGKNVGVATYVVTVARNQITDRRRATPDDECDSETYQPLQPN
jgi:hypothetical protein